MGCGQKFRYIIRDETNKQTHTHNIGRLLTKFWGKRYIYIDFSEWAKYIKIFVSCVNIHQRVTSTEEDCNNQVDRKTRSVDTSQPLPTVTLPSPSELMNTVAMVVGMEVMPGL